MASKPVESIESETSVQELRTAEHLVEEDQVDAVEEDQVDATPTLANEPVIKAPENLGEKDEGEDYADNVDDATDDPPGLINEYNSAVNYISNLIDQLRDTPGVPRAVQGFAQSLKESDLDSGVTQELQEVVDDGSSTILLADSEDYDESVATLQFEETETDLEQGGSPDVDETAITTRGGPAAEKGRRQSMIHNLREAAHLATYASLELNDCAAFAHRAYICAVLGCTSSLISTLLAVMSPQATTLGFAISMAAFSLALGLGLKYWMSLRAFVNKSAQTLKSRPQSVEPVAPIV